MFDHETLYRVEKKPYRREQGHSGLRACYQGI